ncbi:MAG: carbonic anhydrase [Chloroflexota bacterium]
MNDPYQANLNVAGDQVLNRLMAGNQRYASEESVAPNHSTAYRGGLSSHQNPIAAILACADCQVPPSLIFDQALGDLYVIQVAGNIVDNSILSSLEFAVTQLQVPLIMVLGHAGCHAVSTTLDNEHLPGHLPHVATAIQPAIEYVKYQPGGLVDNTIRTNIHLVNNQLCKSEPVLAPRIATGHLSIVPAYYDSRRGQVEILRNPGIRWERPQLSVSEYYKVLGQPR